MYCHLCRVWPVERWCKGQVGWRLYRWAKVSVRARQPYKGKLFGGAGFVPDVPSLQAWLECAWQLGFDPDGAKQLGHNVQARLQHDWLLAPAQQMQMQTQQGVVEIANRAKYWLQCCSTALLMSKFSYLEQYSSDGSTASCSILIPLLIWRSAGASLAVKITFKD